MKKIGSLLVLMSCIFASFAQTNYYKVFNHLPYGAWGRCVISTPDGNYLLAGNADYESTSTKTALIKINPAGDTLWTKTYNLQNFDTELLSLLLMPDSTYILFGIAMGVTGGFLGKDYNFILHTDENGDTLSSKFFGAPLSGALTQSVFRFIQPSLTGGFIFAGFEALAGGYLSTLGASDISGNILWKKQYTGEAVDGGYIYSGNALFQQNDGSIISLMVLQDGTGLPRDHAILKTDTAGNILWVRKYKMQFNNIFKAQNGGYIIYGYSSAMMPEPAFIMKVDSLGYFTSMNNYSYGGIIKQTSDNGYAIYGPYHPTQFSPADSVDAFFSKVDSSGNVSWIYRYGDPIKYDFIKDICETPSHGFITTGNHGLFEDIMLFAIDNTGIFPCANSQPLPYTTSSKVANDTAVTLTVSSPDNIVYPSLSFNYGGTLNETDLCLPLNIIDSYKEDIHVYPNPFSDKVSIQTNWQKFTISLTDLVGREIYSVKSFSQTFEISLPEIADGMYIISLQNENQRIIRQIIKVSREN